jgi:AsmA protein
MRCMHRGRLLNEGACGPRAGVSHGLRARPWLLESASFRNGGSGRLRQASRWVIGGMAGLVILAALAIVTLTLLIDPNRFRGEIESRVRAATGRPFDIQGDLEVAWFPWLAVRTGAAQLGNPPGMAGPPLARWQSLRVGVRLIPLLKGQLIIDRVRLEGLQAHLRRTQDGRANWDDLLSGGADNSERPAPQLAGLEVSDGTLEYVDERSGASVRISKWDLDVGAWRTNAVVPVTTEFMFEDMSAAKSLPTIDLDLRTSVQLAGGMLSLSESQLSGRVRGMPFELAIPQLLAETSPLKLAVSQWTLGVANARLSGSLTADEQGERLRARGPLSITIPSARKFLTDVGVSTSLPRDTDALGELRLTTSWAYVDGAFALKPIALRVDDTAFTGEVVRSNAKEPTWTFDLRGDHIDLARYLITEDKSDEPLELPVDALKAMRAQGTLGFAQARFADTQMKNARLRVVLEDGQVRTSSTQ